MTDAPETTPRLLPPVYFFAAMAAMAALWWWLPLVTLAGWPWRAVGFVVIAAGVALAMWAFGLFQRAGTGVKPFSPSTALVVHGPYRWTRNPMYVSLTAGLIGWGIVLGALSPFVVVPFFVWWIHGRFVLREELHMERHFGDDFRAYMTRVRRWI